MLPPMYRHVDNAGRIYIGTAYADREVVAFITYPQVGDKEQFVQVGRSKLPQYDPWMSRKNELATAVRYNANEITNAHFGSSFIDCNLDGPNDNDYDLFDKIIEDVIENEIYQVDGEPGLSCDPDDYAIINEYVKEYVEEYSMRDPDFDEERGRMLVNMAIGILFNVLRGGDED